MYLIQRRTSLVFGYRKLKSVNSSSPRLEIKKISESDFRGLPVLQLYLSTYGRTGYTDVSQPIRAYCATCKLLWAFSMR